MMFGSLADISEQVAETLNLVANGKRLAILCHLAEAELSVGEIASRVGLSQSALSQHLAKLREKELVRTRRDRQLIYYSCDSEPVVRLLHALNTIYVN